MKAKEVDIRTEDTVTGKQERKNKLEIHTCNNPSLFHSAST